MFIIVRCHIVFSVVFCVCSVYQQRILSWLCTPQSFVTLIHFKTVNMSPAIYDLMAINTAVEEIKQKT